MLGAIRIGALHRQCLAAKHWQNADSDAACEIPRRGRLRCRLARRGPVGPVRRSRALPAMHVRRSRTIARSMCRPGPAFAAALRGGLAFSHKCSNCTWRASRAAIGTSILAASLMSGAAAVSPTVAPLGVHGTFCDSLVKERATHIWVCANIITRKKTLSTHIWVIDQWQRRSARPGRRKVSVRFCRVLIHGG